MKISQVKTSFEAPRQTYQLKTSFRQLVGLEEKEKSGKKNLFSMYLFDECMYSPTSASNKKKLVPKEKIGQAQSKEVKFLLSPTRSRSRPCQSITLIYFHHPPIILNLFPFSLLVVLKNYRKALFYYRKQKYIEHKFIFAIT